MIRKLILAIAAAAALTGGVASDAHATSCSVVTYTRLWHPLDSTRWGAFGIVTAPYAQYTVSAEQSNGSYLVVRQGVASALGVATFYIQETGNPRDGLPQFGVCITGGYGLETFAISDPSEEWWLE